MPFGIGYQSGPGMGFGGGYNDPYGSGFRPGMGQYLMSPGGPPNPGMPNLGRVTPYGGGMPTPGRGGGIGQTIGGAIAGAGSWLTDPEQGMQRQALLANGLGAVSSIYGAHKADKRAERDREDELRREEEARERYDSWNPMRAKLIEQLMSARGER